MERWPNKVGPMFEVPGSKLKTYDTPWACRCLVDEAGGGTRGSLAPPLSTALTQLPATTSSSCSSTRVVVVQRDGGVAAGTARIAGTTRRDDSRGGGSGGASLEGLKGLSWQ